jgi:hypothetical protein
VIDAGPSREGARPLAKEGAKAGTSDDLAPAPTEIVTRPEPGVGRGKFEASGLSIGLLGGTAVVLFGAFLLWKRLKQRRARAKK